MIPRPENGPELCLNIWWFVLEGTDWVNQWAVRAYMLSGTDEQKLATLHALAPLDFTTVPWQPVPDRFQLVNPFGEEMAGITTLFLLREDQGFFENDVLGYLQRTINFANRITTSPEEPLQLTISTTPLQCDTVVMQTRDGRVRAVI